MSPALRVVVSCVLGTALFALPVPWGGRWTVPFDVVVKTITTGAPGLVSAAAVGLIAVGAVGSLVALARPDGPARPFAGGVTLAVLRVLGLGLALCMALGVGPGWLLAKPVAGLMWGILVASVAVIVPIGAVALQGFVAYGALDLVGTLFEPVMRPLFRLPGRAALDGITSWVGSYSVGLYLTRMLFDEGRYTRREAFIIATCFSTVSIGFVGVVASTLDLLALFPVIFGAYFVLVYGLAAVLVWLPPVTWIPETRLQEVPPEPEPPPLSRLLPVAWERALAAAADAPPLGTVLWRGAVDGLVLTASLLGTILTVGTAAVLLAEHTPVFELAGRPLVPVLAALGFSDPEVLAPACLAGITEMYIPALLVRDASVEGRFFIAILSISQLIFFSSVGPMMLDLFRRIPIRVGHLVLAFALRTALLVPACAALTWLVARLGWIHSPG